MIKITLSEYNALPKDCRGVWSIERDDLPNWAEIRDQHMGKRTMHHNDNGTTVLLVEGLSFEIVEEDFYTREFRCGNSYISRQELEGFSCPFCTKDTTDAQMQHIVDEADAATRASWRIPVGQPIDFQNDDQDDTWWSELEKAAVGQGIPYYEDIIEPVYHGTPDSSVRFSTAGDRVIYFTDSRIVAEEFARAEGRGGLHPGEKPTLIRARITLRTPYVVRSEEEWMKKADNMVIDKQKWIDQGYDGLCYRNEAGVAYYAVFHSSDCEILDREISPDTGPEKLSITELASRIYNLPSGKILHFKRHANRQLDVALVRRLLDEERLMKNGESDGFRLQLDFGWYVELRKEDRPRVAPFRYVVEAYCLDNIQCFLRRYVSMEKALLHCLNGFNENATIPNRYESIQDYLSKHPEQ